MLDAIDGTDAARAALEAGDRVAAIPLLIQACTPDRAARLPDAAEAAGLPGSQVAAYRTVVEHYGQDAGALVTALLNYVRLEPGQAVYVPAGLPHSYIRGTGLEVMTSSDNVIRLGLTGARERGVRSFVSLDPAASHVLADRVQIQQVLVNLLRNAVEALGNGEVSDITTSTIRDGAHVRIGITDTGPGLDPAIAPRLFQAFTSSKQDGMGLGLSICRTIVEAHGGRIWAEPGTDKGAAFYFTLPAASEGDEV